VIRRLTEGDCVTAAAIDLAARGPVATLAPLGPAFFAALYRAFVRTGRFEAFADEVEGAVRGFVIGATAPAGALRAALVRAAIPLGLLVLGRSARRPALVPRLFQTLTHLRSPAVGGPELVVIAVDPAWQHRGVGTRLVAALTEAFERRGVSAYRVAAKAGLRHADAFYRRTGFRVVGDFTLYGEGWRVYERALARSSGERAKL
jgi:GNAT superfamily N-acetyltransferase